MPITLTIALVLIPVLLFAVRIFSAKLPWMTYARPSTWPDVAMLAVGVLGLVLHCVSMFYRDLLAAVPGMGGYIQAVNAVGAASIVLYVLPALLVLVALRRQHLVAVIIVATTLIAVGVTMYNGGPLSVHLVTIAAATIAISGTVALLMRRPGDRVRPAAVG